MYDNLVKRLRDKAGGLEYDGWVDTAAILEEAADVSPVRHGRWKKSYADHEAFGVRPFFRYCSECHEAAVHQYNFCPNCGAKMDGGQGDG